MSCRVTVVGTRRRLDADLPDAVPVAELLVDVAALLGENQNGAGVDWGLFKVGGARLDPELSLADQDVSEGTMLFLRAAATAPAPPEIDDFAGRVAVVVDAQKGRWTATMPVALLAWIAAGALGAAGLAVLVAGDASGRATAGVLGAVISGLAAVMLVRVARRPRLGIVVTLGGLLPWAAAGAGVAGLLGANAPMATAFGLAGACIGSLAALAIVGQPAIAWASGVVEATAIPAIVLAAASVFGAGLLAAAAALAVIEPVRLAAAPPLASRLHRDLGSEGAALVRRLDGERKAEAATLVAASLVVVTSCAVLATSGSWFARGLVAAAALATALRARHHRFAAEVAPLLAGGLTGLTLLEVPLAVWLAIGIRGAAGLALLLTADAVVAVAAAVLVPRWSLSAQMARWLRPLEFFAVAATVPLALGVLGLYDAVVHFARGLG